MWGSQGRPERVRVPHLGLSHGPPGLQREGRVPHRNLRSQAQGPAPGGQRTLPEGHLHPPCSFAIPPERRAPCLGTTTGLHVSLPSCTLSLLKTPPEQLENSLEHGSDPLTTLIIVQVHQMGHKPAPPTTSSHHTLSAPPRQEASDVRASHTPMPLSCSSFGQ